MRKLFLVLVFAAVASGVAVYTEGYTNLRLFWNASEATLTPSNVVAGKFGFVGSYATTDAVYAKPLIVPGVTIASKTYKVLIGTDMSDWLYAFDAAHPGSPYLWKTQMGTPTASRLSNLVYGGNIGCLATPAIDAPNNLIIPICSDGSGWRLAKVNMSTGAISASVLVAAQVTGTGSPTQPNDCTSGSSVVFCYQATYASRPAVTLNNAKIYVSFGQADFQAWHGWFFVYNESDLSLVSAFCVTPNDTGGSIWGGGPVVDPDGNVLVATGNGPTSESTCYNGTSNFCMSLLKFNGSTGALMNWYTPSNWAALNAVDADFGSGGIWLIPSTRLVAVATKDWNITTVSVDCMGKLGGVADGCSAPSIVSVNPSHGTVGPGSGMFSHSMGNGIGYFGTAGGPMFALLWTGSTWTALAQTAASYNTHGIVPSVSSNGSANQIVWGLSPDANNYSTAASVTLRAFNATTLAEIWNSGMVAADNLGNGTKFSSPVVSDGIVYVGLQGGITAMGLRGATRLRNIKITGRASVH